MVAIRPAAARDLEQIGAIYAHYVEASVATFELDPPSHEEWRRRRDNITTRGLPFLVAESGGDVLGYAHAGPWKTRPAYRHTAEDSVYIDPGQVGQGLGTLLLGAVLDASARVGVRQVIAVIADGHGDGKASIALHRRFGFADAGVLRAVGRKHDRWLDTTLMQRDLTR